MDFEDPVAAALRVAEALDTAGIPHALYGGLALAAYGQARATADVDILVADAEAGAVRQALEDAGIATTQGFEGLDFGAVTVDRIGLLGGSEDRGYNVVDLVRPRSRRFRRSALRRAIEATLRDRRIRVIAPEDFVVLKLLSHRAQDLEDVAGVLRRSGEDLDLARIRREVAKIDAEVPASGAAERFALARERARQPKA